MADGLIITRSFTNRRLGFIGLVAALWIVSSLVMILKGKFVMKDAPSPVVTRGDITEEDRGKPSFLGETNADASKYYVLNTDNIQKGDTLYVRIEARDRYNQSRPVGGDFWFTWLSSSEKKHTASTAGKIIDFDNGTYMVEFLAAWSGQADINIVLVHSSDATRFIKNIVWNAEHRMFWQAMFVRNTTTQYSTCTLETPGIWTNKCVYPYERANGRTRLVCGKPRGLPCDTILKYKSDKKRIADQCKQLCKGKEFLFQWKAFEQKINGSTSSVYVKESPSTAVQPDKLPICKPGVHTLGSNGYWVNDRWNPLNCRKFNCWRNDSLIGECLRNKMIYILGDSNGRQYATGLREVLTRLSEINASNTNPYNVTVEFVFHPEAIGSKFTLLSAFKYEVDILDKLTNTECNYIVMFSVWAHFSQWPRDAFYERLLRLREALMRFWKRCPDAPVFFKSPHPREHESLSAIIYSNDFILYGIRKMLLEVFGETGIMYLDIWGMNMANLSKNNVHMPMVVIHQELYMVYSTLCSSMCKGQGVPE